jgi:CBS domain-containing protein
MDKVCEYMTKIVIKCLSDATLLEVRELLTEQRVTRILIVDPAGNPIGIISEKDFMDFLFCDKSMRGLEEIPAEEVMTSDLITINRYASMAEAAETMIEEEIGSLVVKDGQLEGIITKADIVTYVAATGNETPVGQYMTHNPATVRPSQSIFSTIDLLLRERISRVVVIDEESRPVGIIAPADLTFADSMVYLSRMYVAGGPPIAPVLHSCRVTVKDFMTKNPVCVNLNSDLATAAKLMTRHRISGLPVTDDAGKLMGMISKTDMTIAVAHKRNRLVSQKVQIS